MPIVIKIVELNNGSPTPFDDQYVSEYDPARDDFDPSGRPMLAFVTCTDDITLAAKFPDHGKAWEYWKQTDPRNPVRPDGQPNRPLTAFSVALYHIESAT